MLEGRVAIVTGAGVGIGRAHALALARHGARVVVNDLGVSRDGAGAGSSVAETVAEEIRAAGGEAVASVHSVADRDGVEAMVQTAQEAFGAVDILVNNAGILRDRTLLKMTDEEWTPVIDVHLRGTFLCTQVAARAMREAGRGGAIVNTTSVSGLVGAFGQANYAAAKMGIVGLTFTAATELAKYDIRVNAIAPIALTRMTQDLPEREDDPRFGPEYVAPAVVYLASPLAVDLTGVVLGVEGPRVFEYRIVTSDGVRSPGDAPWEPAQLGQQLSEIRRLRLS